jgi:putative transposase
VRRQSEAATALWMEGQSLCIAFYDRAPNDLMASCASACTLSAGYVPYNCWHLQEEHHFRARERLEVLHRGLLSVANDFGWRLEAWSVFSNHYHFVAHSPDEDADNLAQMLGFLHEKTAKWINRLDGASGREVWHNFWETKLTHRNSYFARLNYVHQNPVRHGLVAVANQYPWCSAGWFERTARLAQVKTVYGFKIDKLKVLDDYEVVLE